MRSKVYQLPNEIADWRRKGDKKEKPR